MILATPSVRRFLLGTASLVLVQAAHAESDARRVICARPCILATKTANGTIEVKTPFASNVLKTLAQQGDSFKLEAGREYVLVFKESQAGFSRFDLNFSPVGTASTWSCRVQTLAVPPFIGVANAVWSGTPSRITINTDRVKPFISMD